MNILLAPTDQQARLIRYLPFDVLRGLAILGVVLFHLVWDLVFLGLIPAEWATHPAWLAFGRALATTFMVLVGGSLALASRSAFDRSSFFIRLAKVAAGAIGITLVTRFFFPNTYIYFGILHAIAVSSLVCALFVRSNSTIPFLVGLLIIVLGLTWENPAFDPRTLAWIGFAASPPPSNDFVPVFPWVGVSLLGLVGMRMALLRGWMDLLPACDGPFTHRLGAIGRWSLAIYLLHQPVLLAILYPIAIVAT